MKKSDYNAKLYRNHSGFLRTINRGKCELCGKRNKIKDVHHIDGNSDNNALTNLLLVCKECHQLAHKSRIRIPELTRMEHISLACINFLQFYRRYVEDRYSKAFDIDVEEFEAVEPFAHPNSSD